MKAPCHHRPYIVQLIDLKRIAAVFFFANCGAAPHELNAAKSGRYVTQFRQRHGRGAVDPHRAAKTRSPGPNAPQLDITFVIDLDLCNTCNATTEAWLNRDSPAICV
jgi:hypothetical protein